MVKIKRGDNPQIASFDSVLSAPCSFEFLNIHICDFSAELTNGKPDQIQDAFPFHMIAAEKLLRITGKTDNPSHSSISWLATALREGRLYRRSMSACSTSEINGTSRARNLINSLLNASLTLFLTSTLSFVSVN